MRQGRPSADRQAVWDHWSGRRGSRTCAPGPGRIGHSCTRRSPSRARALRTETSLLLLSLNNQRDHVIGIVAGEPVDLTRPNWKLQDLRAVILHVITETACTQVTSMRCVNSSTAAPGWDNASALTGSDSLADGMRAHSRAAGAFRSESKYAAQTSVDIVHEGSRKLAGFGVQVGLVDGDQGGDVDDGVFGQSRGCCGQEDVAGQGRQAGAGGDDGGDGGFQAAGVERAGLDDQDRAALGGLAAAGLAEIGPPDAAALDHQPSWRARRLRPAAAAAAADSSGSAGWSASSICRVSDREASSSRYLRAARAKNSDRLMPSSAACFVACSKVSSGREIRPTASSGTHTLMAAGGAWKIRAMRPSFLVGHACWAGFDAELVALRILHDRVVLVELQDGGAELFQPDHFVRNGARSTQVKVHPVLGCLGFGHPGEP